MDELFGVAIRSLISLATLFFVTKCIGKKQVSELSLFDYVIGLSIGNFAAEITINKDVNLIDGILAVVIFGLVSYIVSYLTMKSMKIRRFMIGTPTVVMENGRLIYENLKKNKFDINDFLEECREDGYFDISKIEYAIIEANGKVSILPKSEYGALTPNDMNIKVPKQGLVANIIIDGELLEENLKKLNKTKEWFNKNLKVKGYDNYDNILLATVDINEKIVVYDKKNSKKVSNILE